MAKFTHYLVTRFNVPEARWQQDKSGSTTLDEQWFDQRMELFATYCIPSVKNQNKQNFHWVIYCDSATDPNYLERITQSIDSMISHSIRLVESLEQMLIDLRKYLSECVTPYVITSRLDNDDGIARDFIRSVQDHFVEKDKVLLHFDDGIIYDCLQHIATRLHSKTYNHFTSLIERKSVPAEMITVYGFHHTHVPDAIEVRRITDGLHWLKIIHDRNVRSQLKGVPLFKISKTAFGKPFHTSLNISWTNTVRYVVMRLWNRKLK